MSKTEITFNSVEDMVAYVTRNPGYNADRRWTLESSLNMEFVNLDAGVAWMQEKSELEDQIREAHGDVWPYDKEMKPEWKAKLEDLKARKPEMHPVGWYSLHESDGNRWNNTYIRLDFHLGEAIDAIWTKGTRGYYSSAKQRLGRMTIPGILKRLGETEVGGKIAAAKAEEKRRSEINGRNYHRREIQKAAKTLKEAVEKAEGIVLPVTAKNLLAALQKLMDIKEEEY